MPPAMTKRDLVDRAMGGVLAQYVRSRREMTPKRSWVSIAGDIRAAYDLEVTDESLRQWYPDPPTEETT